MTRAALALLLNMRSTYSKLVLLVPQAFNALHHWKSALHSLLATLLISQTPKSFDVRRMPTSVPPPQQMTVSLPETTAYDLCASFDKYERDAVNHREYL